MHRRWQTFHRKSNSRYGARRLATDHCGLWSTRMVLLSPCAPLTWIEERFRDVNTDSFPFLTLPRCVWLFGCCKRTRAKRKPICSAVFLSLARGGERYFHRMGFVYYQWKKKREKANKREEKQHRNKHVFRASPYVGDYLFGHRQANRTNRSKVFLRIEEAIQFVKIIQ